MYFACRRKPSARRVPTAAHEGTRADFLRRHEEDAAAAARRGGEDRAAFLRTLFDRVADDRLLLLAAEHVCTNGGDAAGADGTRPSHLDRLARVHLARTLRAMLRDGSYRPGAVREVQIPKANGK